MWILKTVIEHLHYSFASFIFYFLDAVHHPEEGSSGTGSTTGLSRFAFIGFSSISCSHPTTIVDKKNEKIKWRWKNKQKIRIKIRN